MERIIEPDLSRINWKHPPDLGPRFVAKSDGLLASAVHQSGSPVLGWVSFNLSPASVTVAF
jgi:hypothetical protein